MRDINLDKSRLVRLHARVREASVPRTLVFVEQDPDTDEITDHDITDYDFELIVYKSQNSLVKLFTLTIGEGLEVVDTNKLLIEITAAQATVNPGTYFWRLHSIYEDHTWLNGPFEFHQGESDAVEEEDTVNIYQNG